MDQKKGSSASSAKPKTPHSRKIHAKQQLDGIKKGRKITEDLILTSFDAAPGNIFAAVEAGNYDAVRKFVEIAADPAVINRYVNGH